MLEPWREVQPGRSVEMPLLYPDAFARLRVNPSTGIETTS